MAVGHRGYLVLKAERTGFEPANRFCRLHAFQACLFNHSSTSPLRFAGAKLLLFGEKKELFEIKMRGFKFFLGVKCIIGNFLLYPCHPKDII